MQKQISKDSLKLTRATLKDIDSVIEIENQNSPNPWKKQLFLNEISNHLSSFLIALHDGVLCGFIIFWTVGDEVELHNISVKEGFKRQGIASALVKEMIRISQKQCKSIFLEVRESNHKGVSFYIKSGFQKTGKRENYYSNPKESAIIMAKNLL